MKKLIAVCLMALTLVGCVVQPVPYYAGATVYDASPVVVESEVVYPAGIVIGVGGYWDHGVWFRGPYHGHYWYHGRHFAHRH